MVQLSSFDHCTAQCCRRITDIWQRNGLVLPYLPPYSSHFLHWLDLSIFGFTTRSISAINRNQDVDIQTSHTVKSFKNSGISIRREGQQVLSNLTAETVRVYPAEEAMDVFGPEAAEEAEIESANLELGGFPLKSAAVASGEHGEQGEHAY
jgi:hypothetical protein